MPEAAQTNGGGEGGDSGAGLNGPDQGAQSEVLDTPIEAPTPQSASDLELFEQYLEKDMGMEQPDRGDLRKGIIVEVRSSELVVDIGSKRDGVVPQSDLAAP